ncbi:MAG: fibronectin type III domain-containing protein, partial [candidate division Zixibacteria bacterium]|nr:fibronectin type III domain-containing protein [candidate division Zixibacteria bacterium]
LQVDDSSDFSGPESDLGFTPPTHSVSIGLTDNCLPQYWRVRAKNACSWSDWSVARTVTVCSTPTAPTLESPANDAIDIAQPVALNWNNIAGISNYQIQIDTTLGFAHPVVNRQRTVSSDSVSELVGSTIYYWRVRAASSCAASAWSSTYNFTTAVCNVPDAAVLVAPVDGDSGQTQPLTLDWSDAARALSYRVQVDNDSDFSSTVIDNQVTPSTLLILGLTAGTKYYWRIRAYNGCGWGSWSDTSWFKTCYMVEAPVLVTPHDSDTVDPRPVSFDWNDVATASKYQFQIDDTITCISPLVDEQLVASQFGTYDLDYGTRYYWRVRAYGTCGWGAWSTVRTCFSSPTAVEEIDVGNMPTAYSLAQNYPNPFNPSTAIEFTLPRPGQVTLEVYDIVGRKTRTLVSEAVTAGTKRVIWDGCNADGATVASGVYFYRIKAGDFIETRKMLLLK